MLVAPTFRSEETRFAISCFDFAGSLKLDVNIRTRLGRVASEPSRLSVAPKSHLILRFDESDDDVSFD